MLFMPSFSALLFHWQDSFLVEAPSCPCCSCPTIDYETAVLPNDVSGATAKQIEQVASILQPNHGLANKLTSQMKNTY